MNLYEKVLILNPDFDDTAADETLEKIMDVIINKGGEILKTDRWGRRKLAYQLNKHQKGNYFILLFKSPSSTIAELERVCKVTDAVIKYMVIKLTKKKQIDSILSSLSKPETDRKEHSESPAPTASAETRTTEETAASGEESENVQ